VIRPPLLGGRRSDGYYRMLFDAYPLMRELMGYDERHDGETVLDYGCGTGDGTLLLARAGARVHAADASATAIRIARLRLAGAGVPRERATFELVDEVEPRLTLPDASVDYVHCHGVIQHATHPDAVFREIARVLAPAGRGRIMVYSRASIWWHVYVPSRVQQPGEGLEEAFRRSTDGAGCPISRAYEPADFVAEARRHGLNATFTGGYLCRAIEIAVAPRQPLSQEHSAFLDQLEWRDGIPTIDARAAGIAGVFEIVRAA
jgi:SAM-dependent methyltransferase